MLPAQVCFEESEPFGICKAVNCLWFFWCVVLFENVTARCSGCENSSVCARQELVRGPMTHDKTTLEAQLKCNQEMLETELAYEFFKILTQFFLKILHV